MENKPPRNQCHLIRLPRPWQFVSQDIFQLGQKQFLIKVDHYSDFYELNELCNTLSATVVKANVVRHGIPSRCLTANGPQFISNEYKLSANKFEFEHVTTSPTGLEVTA